MSVKKSGPVKPPIIDLSANKSKEEAKQNTAKSAKAKVGKAAKTDKGDVKSNSPFLLSSIIGAVGGAIIGLASAFLLALAGFWPNQSSPIASVSGIVEQNGIAIIDLKDKVGSLEGANSLVVKNTSDLVLRFDDLEQNVNTQVGVQEKSNQVENELLSQFKQEIEDLKIADQKQTERFISIDLSPIENQIAMFDERLNALAAGTSNDEAVEFALSIAKIKKSTNDILVQIDGLNEDYKQNNIALSLLESKVDNFDKKLAEEKQASATQEFEKLSLQLPISLTAFESAIYNGKSFDASLNKLSVDISDVKIPEKLQELAIGGLVNPEDLIIDFGAKVPAILNARPIDKDANWRKSLLDKASSLIALRPKGQVEGDDPPAIIAQIEAALSGRDFRKARDLINDLPPLMQQAVGAINDDIANLALAQEFAQDLRNIILKENTKNKEAN
jgi:hypothetical protein